MKKLTLSITLLFFLSACQQEAPLQIDESQYFHDKFPNHALALDYDDGREVRLSAQAPSQNSVRGAFFNSTTGYCNSIYGCQNNPYSYLYGYFNNMHAYNPSFNVNVNLRFGQMNFQPFYNYRTQYIPYEPDESCWDLTFTANKPIRVLRFISGQSRNISCVNDIGFDWPYDPNASFHCPTIEDYTVSGSGTNTVKMTASQVSHRGNIIFSLEDSMNDNCYYQPYQWWNFKYYAPPTCGAYYGQTTLRVTGKGGRCGAEVAIDFDMTPYVNNDLSNSYYNMPYFNYPVSGGQYSLSGRVMEYAGQHNRHHWYGGGYNFNDQFNGCNNNQYGYYCMQ